MGVVAVVVMGLVIVVPIAWLISEFQGRAWLRVLLGFCAIAVSVWVAHEVGLLGQEWNDNAWFSSANARLLDTTISEMEKGKSEKVLAELKHLREQYRPTYDGHGRYDVLVDEAVVRMKTPAATQAERK